MKESNTQREIWKSLNHSVMFRVNTGKAILSATGKIQWRQDGVALVEAPRPITLGFAFPDGKPVVGTSDLIGWTTITVTPEMVGKRLAVFTAIECKASTGGKKREEQVKFLGNVIKAGGIGGFANSPESAQDAFAEFRERMGL